MRNYLAALASGMAVLAAGMVVTAGEDPSRTLRPVAAFPAISDQRERSVAFFTEAGKVIMHPRCMNCHPRGDRPTQGDDSHPHQPLVVRGDFGLGAPGMRCTTCHGPANFDPGGVPGHPLWHVAPIEMAWQGKSLAEICAQIKDPERNGGKTLEQLVHHMEEDSFVGWGWHPGAGREPVPGTQKDFGILIKAWVDSGAACPTP
jgi:hypothetical protein